MEDTAEDILHMAVIAHTGMAGMAATAATAVMVVGQLIQIMVAWEHIATCLVRPQVLALDICLFPILTSG